MLLVGQRTTAPNGFPARIHCSGEHEVKYTLVLRTSVRALYRVKLMRFDLSEALSRNAHRVASPEEALARVVHSETEFRCSIQHRDQEFIFWSIGKKGCLFYMRSWPHLVNLQKATGKLIADIDANDIRNLCDRHIILSVCNT